MKNEVAKLPRIEPLEDGRIEIITTHMNADFDAVASMIAAGRLYPQAKMVFPGSQERNIRNFFIQSVIYLFNVVRVKDVDLTKVGRLILVDTRQAARIGVLSEVLENENLEIHIYDHHPDGPDDISGTVEVLGDTGSNTTIMTELLTAKGIEVSSEEATVLALGIYEDTGSFTFLSTTPRDYRAAAILKEKGADLNVVAELISRELTVDQVALLHEMLNSAITHTINGIDVTIAQATSEYYVDELAILVHKMMDMRNLKVTIALVRMEGRIYMVARSRMDRVNVGEVAQQMGGGGHATAAAATIKDLTLAQTESKLIRILHTELGPVMTARDIMAYPVISVTPDGELTEAREKMVRYNINVLLVIDAKGALVGHLSRQNVSKALHHGLPDYPVSELMTTEFGVVGPDATFPEIQTLIVEQKQRVVPVVEDGKAVGVITRTDLLNILTSQADLPGAMSDEGRKTGRHKKIQNLMRERLPKKLIDLLADLGQTADELGFGAYAVGGFVRDLFLRQENLDVDVVIEGDAIKFAEYYGFSRPWVRVRTHQKFNTAVLIFKDGFKVDVTTARLEYYEHPGALPIVEGGSIHLDLYRRDFTINSLAVSLNKRNFGTVIDYFRGLQDLKDGFIRVLHNLSFVEDPTRVFRAIRFEQRFGFRVGKLTSSLIQNAVKHDFFQKLSGKRIAGEVRLILEEEDPGPAVARLAEFDLLKFIHPSLAFDRKRRELFKKIKQVRDWFDLTWLKEKYDPWIVYFLGLADGLSREDMSVLARKLVLPKKAKTVMIEEKPRADRALNWLYRLKDPSPAEIFYQLTNLSTESLLFIMAKTSRDQATRAISAFFTEYRHVKPEIGGKELMELGFEPGPQFKEILEAVRAARLDGVVSNLEEERVYVHGKFRPIKLALQAKKGH